MTFFSRNVGVRRLAILLSLAGAGAALMWEYENSPAVSGWRSYRAAQAALAVTPRARLVAHDDGSVVLIQSTPAEAALPPIEGEGGWKILQPAHGEETREIGTYYFAREGDWFAALLAVVLSGLGTFFLAHAVAWVVHGFRGTAI